MKAAEMIPFLERWKTVYEALAQADGEMANLTGRSPESRLFTGMWNAMGGYSEFLELHLVGSTTWKWLDWYQFECRMGERPMEVKTDHGTRNIGSVEDLAMLLEECRAPRVNES